MRITALSRKLGVTRDEINSFLKSKGYEVPEGINAKISDTEAQLVIEEFGAELMESSDESDSKESADKKQVEVEIEEPKEEPIVKEEKAKTPKKKKDKPLEETQESPNAEHEIPEKHIKKEEKPEEKIDSAEDPMPSDDESLEDFLERQEVKIIKAKKVKLEGVKVVGKIDLPEPPPPKEKKEEKEIVKEEKKQEEKKEKPKGLYEEYMEKSQRKFSPKRKVRKQKRVLTFQEKQDLEKKKLEREKQKRQKALKKKKEQHYEQKVKPKIQKKEKPKKKEEIIEKVEKKIVEQKRPKPRKTVFSKFWSWLNGDYDKF